MKLWPQIAVLWQVLFLVSAKGFTLDGSVEHQPVEGIGVNLNYRSWDGTNLQPALDAFIDQAGMSVFRVTHDLSDWEAVNDDADPHSMNWDYYNSIYSTNEFTRLWDMFEYLNSRGCTNKAFLAFMGWGPEWMMAADGRTLAAGMEEEWAEMIASALIYARNTRGLQFTLVAPNNEPDVLHEGIRMPTAAQFTNALHRLAVKLDAAGMTDLSFVAPDRAQNSYGYEYMPEMLADPVIMARVQHFGLHNYNSSGGYTSNAYSYVQTHAPGRTLWITECNVWCPGCDDGILGNYGWDYTRGTAQLLLLQLAQGASAAMVWEGYDSVYAHHDGKWGFWGLMGVDDTNATVKTYTPRKHFYTVSQVSKWIRPGARRIGISGSTSPFSPLVAFKHDELGQVTIAGVNPGSAANLSGSMVSVPSVREFQLFYTTATTNLADGGVVPVEAGGFHKMIPADCVFTLTGFTAQRLTNGVPMSATHSGSGSMLDDYRFTVTDPVARAQVEVRNPSGDVTLLLRKDLPPSLDDFHYASANPGTNGEMIVLRPGSSHNTLTAGDWFIGVMNHSGTNVSYTVEARQWSSSGAPIIVVPGKAQSGGFWLSWNSLPGAVYVVQGKPLLTTSPWEYESDTVVASNFTTSFYSTQDTAKRFFRIFEGLAVKGIGEQP